MTATAWPIVRVAVGAACALFLAGEAPAQTLSLQMSGGRVTLDAENVPIRQVLERWAEVGHARVVNADRLPADAVTLRLTDVPEREALATLLRNAAGYILTARRTADGDSDIEQILLVPHGTAQRTATMAPTFRPSPGSGSAPLPFRAVAPADRAVRGPDGRETGGARDSGSAAAQLPQLGVYTGDGPPNLPTFGATSEDDLSRYKGMLEPATDQPSAGDDSSQVPDNPFGITRGAARPGAPTPEPANRGR